MDIYRISMVLQWTQVSSIKNKEQTHLLGIWATHYTYDKCVWHPMHYNEGLNAKDITS